MAMLKPAPGGKLPESNRPSSDVTLCGWLETFVQWTLPPAETLKDGGSKPESVMRISLGDRGGTPLWARLDEPGGPASTATATSAAHAAAASDGRTKRREAVVRRS